MSHTQVLKSERHYNHKNDAFVPLPLEKRTHLSTNDCAYHLDRSAGTLRRWASLQTGPIQPIKVGTQNMWPVARIRELLGAEL